jgi:hypothetical protein
MQGSFFRLIPCRHVQAIAAPPWCEVDRATDITLLSFLISRNDFAAGEENWDLRGDGWSLEWQGKNKMMPWTAMRGWLMRWQARVDTAPGSLSRYAGGQVKGSACYCSMCSCSWMLDGGACAHIQIVSEYDRIYDQCQTALHCAWIRSDLWFVSHDSWYPACNCIEVSEGLCSVKYINKVLSTYLNKKN